MVHKKAKGHDHNNRTIVDEGVPIMERSPQHMRDEYPVIISLAISLGSIIVAIVGWWLLRT